MDKKITVAIDGYSSSGKSTMAKQLAKAVGYRYVDSGAMYRAVTLYALRNGMVDPNNAIDEKALLAALPSLEINFSVTPTGQHTLLNGEDVESQIRSMEVNRAVSPVAAIPAVRHALVAMQQAMGRDKGIVMDGRDIGTVVFPDAELKIFVNASAETRARRRLLEMEQKGIPADYQSVLDNLRQRDLIDSTRSEGPLRRPDDAVDFDNSDMTIERQNEYILQLFNSTLERLG